MNLIKNHWLAISPKIKTGIFGVHLNTVEGDLTQVVESITDQIKLEAWNPARIISIGISEDENNDARLHMVYLSTSDTKTDIAQVKTTINKDQLNSLQLDGYNYVHMVTQMDTSLNLAVIDAGAVKLTEVTQQAFNTLFDTLYRNDRTLKCSRTQAQTMLMYGGEGERTILAQIDGVPSTFKSISVPFDTSEVQARTAVIGTEVFAIATYQSDMLYATTSKQIIDYLTGEVQEIDWNGTQIEEGNISEIAIVDGAKASTLLTLEDSKYRFIPVQFSWNDNGDIVSTTTDIDKAVLLTKVKDNSAPIVRLNVQAVDGQGFVAQVDKNGGSNVVAFSTVEKFGSYFAEMANAATSDNVAVAYA